MCSLKPQQELTLGHVAICHGADWLVGHYRLGGILDDVVFLSEYVRYPETFSCHRTFQNYNKLKRISLICLKVK